jgi:hypothetical protein
MVSNSSPEARSICNKIIRVRKFEKIWEYQVQGHSTSRRGRTSRGSRSSSQGRYVNVKSKDVSRASSSFIYVSPSLSIGHQTMEPSKGHQSLEPSIGHRVEIFFTSFLFFFFKKVNSDHWGFLSPNIIFNSNLENTCFHKLVEEENND